MIQNLTIGQYYPNDSVVHSLDPRTKLLAAFLYIVLLFLVQNSLWYLPIAGTLLLLYRLSKVPFSYFLKGLKGVILLLCFTFFFRMTLTPGTEIAGFWIFTITQEGIAKAIHMTVRIALMIAGASLLSYTSTPQNLCDELEKSLHFLGNHKVPIHSMSVILMIAFRFIPIMIEEMNILMDAQAARGTEFQQCSVWRKSKNMIVLLVPLFFSTVQRASDLAMAMEARGYRENGEVSRMYPLCYTDADRKAKFAIWLYFGIMAMLVLFVL